MADVDHGVLVIADISGYTRFVSGLELEHSTAIVADLLGVVVDELHGLAALAKLEGDAAFCVAAGEPASDTVKGALFACYDAFRRRLRDARHLTTCPCAACRGMGSLDLKIVVHHGEYVTQTIAARREVAGPAVIAVHRLLKNTVAETTGLHGYALLTRAAVDACAVPVDEWGCTAGVEEVDGVGEVEVFVLDLPAAWAQEQERAAVVVDRDGARVLTYDVPVTPAELWEWFGDPVKRRQWNLADRIDVESSGSVSGVGTVNHCVHGKAAITEEILDWKPYQYCTLRVSTPVGRFLMTVTLEPRDGSTSTEVRLRPDASGLRAAAVRLALATKVRKDFDAGMQRLLALVRAPTGLDLPR